MESELQAPRDEEFVALAAELKPRILVACPMKCGSTYICRVLSRYFQIATKNEAVAYPWDSEHNLTDQLLSQFQNDGFILQMHLRPNSENRAGLAEYGISAALLWRNLGDALISFDDHVRNESHVNPVAYIADRQRYLAMPDQRRYQYLIRHAVPWYLSFYVAWRNEAQGPLFRYEWMVRDKSGFFSKMIESLVGSVSTERLGRILSAPFPGTRFNKGQTGRSAAAFSIETRALLEEFILEHPEDLEELRNELPWKNQEHQLIRRQYDESGRVYVVRNGTRRWIPDHSWMLSHGVDWPDVRELEIAAFSETQEKHFVF